MTSVTDPECLTTDPTFFPSRIPDPSYLHPGSRILIKNLIPTLAKPDPDLINCKVGAGSGPGSEQQGNKSNPDPHQQDADPHKGLGDHFSP